MTDGTGSQTSPLPAEVAEAMPWLLPLLNTADLGLYVWRAGLSNYEWVSPRLAALLGTSPIDVPVLSQARRPPMVAGADVERIRLEMANGLSEQGFDVTCEVIVGDGTVRLIRDTLVPLERRDGAIARGVGLVRVLSEGEQKNGTPVELTHAGDVGEDDGIGANALIDSIVQSLDEGIAYFDAEDRLRRWNARFIRFYPELLELIDDSPDFETSYRHVIASEELPAAEREKKVAARLANHRARVHDGEHITADGRHLRIREVPVAAGGSVIAFADVTELKMREQSLREEHEKLQSLVSELPVAVALWGPDDRLQLWNPEFERLCGAAGAQLQVGLSFEEGARRVAAERAVAENAPSAQAYVQRRLLQRESGEEFTIQVDGRTYLSRDIRLRSGGILHVHIDVTDTHERMELEAREALLTTILDSVQDPIVLYDADGRMRRWNRAMKVFLDEVGAELVPGGTLEENIRRSWARTLSPEDIEQRVEWRLANHRSNYHEPMEVTQSNGRRYLMREAMTPAGECIVIWTDLTELLEREEALRRSNEELEQFAYVASHDLQEPLRMVTGFSNLVMERYGSQLDAQGREYLDYAVDGATRMQSMIAELLAYSRVGRDSMQVESVALDEVVAEVLQLLAGVIEDNEARVDVAALPRVTGSKDLLIRLFQNLLSNALKFRSEEHPHIQIGLSSQDQSEVVVAVSDNGIGIDARYFERIFQPFQRLHHRGEVAGTGIGLAICRKIAESHGGAIEVVSSEGQGTTFFITLRP